MMMKIGFPFCCAIALMGLITTMAMGADYTGGPCYDVNVDDIVFCENFDTYCVGGNPWTGYPPFPAACVDNDTGYPDVTPTPDDIAYLTNWLKPFNCGILWLDRTHIAEDVNAWGNVADYNPPFALRYEGCFANNYTWCAGSDPWNLASSRHMMSMASAINDQWSGASEVLGTNSYPLKLKFHLNHMSKDDEPNRGGDSANANFYVELCKDGDRAPTDHVWIDCGAAGYTTRGVFPIVCQQRSTLALPQPGFLSLCPPLSTDIHASIAVGMLAILDSNPCDLENGCRPTNYHLAVFDGLKWWDLRQGIGTPGFSEFVLNDGGDSWVEMWVRETSIYIKFTWEKCCGGPNVSSPCWDGYCTKPVIVNEVIIPRQYTGGFNEIAFGIGEGCELDGASYTCAGPDECYTYGSYNDGWGWGHTWLDSLVVYGGMPGVGECQSLPVVTSAMSVKTHGTWDLGIDVLNGDTESRVGGVEKLVVGFDQDVQLLSGNSSVAIGSGTISSVTLTASNEVTVEMSGTTNAMPLAITFPGVAAAGDANCISEDSVCALLLAGDASNDRVITSLDRVLVRDAMIMMVDATNFRRDIAADGVFTSLDRVRVRDAMVTGLPTTDCP